MHNIKNILKYSSLCLISQIALLTTYSGEKGKCGTHNWSWEVVDISYSVKDKFKPLYTQNKAVPADTFQHWRKRNFEENCCYVQAKSIKCSKFLAYLGHSLIIFLYQYNTWGNDLIIINTLCVTFTKLIVSALCMRKKKTSLLTHVLLFWFHTHC